MGIKDSAGDIGQIIDLLRACPREFSVLLGNAPAFLSGLQVGAVGGVLALANVAPRECVAIYDLLREGSADEATAIQFRLMPVGRAVTSQFGVPGLKAALDLLGYRAARRAAAVAVDPARREALRGIPAEAGSWSSAGLRPSRTTRPPPPPTGRRASRPPHTAPEGPHRP